MSLWWFLYIFCFPINFSNAKTRTNEANNFCNSTWFQPLSTRWSEMSRRFFTARFIENWIFRFCLKNREREKKYGEMQINWKLQMQIRNLCNPSSKTFPFEGWWNLNKKTCSSFQVVKFESFWLSCIFKCSIEWKILRADEEKVKSDKARTWNYFIEQLSENFILLNEMRWKSVEDFVHRREWNFYVKIWRFFYIFWNFLFTLGLL